MSCNCNCCTLPQMTIKDVMQPAPHSIAAHETLATAQEKLRQFGFRHLPVQEGGSLLGVITDRDIAKILSTTDRTAQDILIRDCHTEDPYVVEPDVKLGDVARRMAEERLGCALVVQNQKLIGIFTTVDACARLAMVLEMGCSDSCACGCKDPR